MPKVRITLTFLHEMDRDELLDDEEAEEKREAMEDDADWIAPTDEVLAERLSERIGEGNVGVEDLDGFADGNVTVQLVTD